MTTAQNILDVARSQIGYVETPSNITRYWAELEPGLQGQPWCAGFVSWVFKHAGMTLPAMGKPYGFVYCPSAVAYAKAHGLFSASGHYAPGDVVLYGAGGGDHTGIIVSDDGATMAVIEGNTSPDTAGSQTNGGGVYLRHRSHGSWVYGVLQTSRLLAASKPATPPAAPSRTQTRPPIVAPGRNIAMTMAIQRAIHVSADGAWGDVTSAAATAVIRRTTANIRALQGWVGTKADGIWGPNSEAARISTVRAIQRAIGVTGDGDWGPLSQAAWNRAYAANYHRY